MSNALLTNDSPAGVFVKSGKILSAKSVSNQDIYKNGKPVDVGVDIEIEIPGQTFNQNCTVAGNLNLAKAGDKNKVWGSAMKVKILLSDLRVKWTALEPDNSIPQDVLDQIVGKEVWYLRYPTGGTTKTGKPQYRTYPRLVLTSFEDKKNPAMTGDKFLREKYNADVAAGYIKLQEEGGDAAEPTEGDTSFTAPVPASM